MMFGPNTLGVCVWHGEQKPVDVSVSDLGLLKHFIDGNGLGLIVATSTKPPQRGISE